MRHLLIPLLLLPLAAMADQMQPLNVVGFERADNTYWQVNIDDTVADMTVVCSLYDRDGSVLNSSRWMTNDRATRVLITYTGNEAMEVRCAQE